MFKERKGAASDEILYQVRYSPQIVHVFLHSFVVFIILVLLWQIVVNGVSGFISLLLILLPLWVLIRVYLPWPNKVTIRRSRIKVGWLVSTATSAVASWCIMSLDFKTEPYSFFRVAGMPIKLRSSMFDPSVEHVLVLKKHQDRNCTTIAIKDPVLVEDVMKKILADAQVRPEQGEQTDSSGQASSTKLGSRPVIQIFAWTLIVLMLLAVPLIFFSETSWPIRMVLPTAITMIISFIYSWQKSMRVPD